jgi:hypothetical protein
MSETTATHAQDDGPGGLVGKLAAIAADLHRFPKTQMVSGRGGYAFAGVDAMADAIRPAMAARGIVMYPSAVEVVECREVVRERVNQEGQAYETVQWRTVLLVTWQVTDGRQVLALQAVGEALDTSDKSANKAQTASRKYAMIGLLNVTTGDEPDPDHERPGDDGPQRTRRQDARGRPAGPQASSPPGGAQRAAQGPSEPALSEDDRRKVRRRRAALARGEQDPKVVAAWLAEHGLTQLRELLDAPTWLRLCAAAGVNPSDPLPPDPDEAPAPEPPKES